MSDPLEPYFEAELRYVREAIYRRYAKAHQLAAEELHVRPDAIDDPWVSELIDAFAMLNARTERRLNDGFSNIGYGLIDRLYPQLMRPLPSSAICQFQPDTTQKLPIDLPVEKNLETAPVQGEPLRYRLTHPLTILPLQISNCQLTAPQGLASRHALGALSALTFELGTATPELAFHKLHNVNSLRMFLYEPDAESWELGEALLRYLQGIAIYEDNETTPMQELPRTAVRLHGLTTTQSWLPDCERTFHGFQTFFEFLAYPWRFSFFELLLQDLLRQAKGNRLRFAFFFSRKLENLAAALRQAEDHGELIRLNCAPVVNLFEPESLAIEFDQTATEYPLVVNQERPWAHEIYSVNSVTLFDPNEGTEVVAARMYSPPSSRSWQDLPGELAATTLYATRSEPVATKNQHELAGNDIFLSVIDLDNSPPWTEQSIIRAQVTALNRDLPTRVSGDPAFRLRQPVKGLRISCLVRPSRTIRPFLNIENFWQLVSLLSINHLSLVDNHRLNEVPSFQETSLGELLTLFESLFPDDRIRTSTSKLLRSLRAVTLENIVDRVTVGGKATFVRGLNIRLSMESAGLPPGRCYLFANVLSNFFAAYASINSFTRTTAQIDGGSELPLIEPGFGARHLL